MSDLACWRISNHLSCNIDGLVLRIHGSEHFLTIPEAHELANRLTAVANSEVDESLSEAYRDLCTAKARRGTDLLAELGFVRPRPEPIRRRA